MTDATRTELLSTPPFAAKTTAASANKPVYLFGPLSDFLILGGGSVFAFVLVWLIYRDITPAQLAVLITVLMVAINQPHFAHSYQIFYRDFRAKAFGGEYPRTLRWRYFFAGIVVPIALVLFLVIGVVAAYLSGSPRVLTYGSNLMFFLVGWHYVKQGYGILIVDSVQKKLMFSNAAKTIFRVNAYACWIVAWLNLNHAISTAVQYAGLRYYTLPLPPFLFYAAVMIATATTMAMIAVLLLHWRHFRALPYNGVIAYLATLYLWTVFVRINPLFLLIVPTFHSLQYLAVVWRFQLNASTKHPPRNGSLKIAALDRLWPDGVTRRLAVFVALGILFGWLGFMAVPYLLDAAFSYDQRVFGPTPFMFLFYIFINVHHYFLDNVMWRRGNPDIQKHLFSRV